ncbi:MAG: arsenite methyltransferase [bacterium]
MERSDIHTIVRQAYAEIASRGSCGCGYGNCPAPSLETVAGKRMGYSDEELGAIPQEANLGLGCGNPTALAGLSKGEVVLDLGSGGGIDCFLAASAVGEGGRVIGVDMTPPMIDQARATARSHGYGNVEFRLGEIENLPAADTSVDAVISNCVINLSPDKPRVFREAYRVLKPGGRLMVSDIVLVGELPALAKDSPEAYVSCLAGAVSKKDYLSAIGKAGFQQVEILSEQPAGAKRPNKESSSPSEHEAKPRQPTTVEELQAFDQQLAAGELEVFATSIQVRAFKPA